MIGVVLLVIVSLLIFLGLAQRVLDRLYLSDRGGLLVIAAMVAGSFIDIPIMRNPSVSLNVGGALVPIGLAIYVLVKAGSRKEVWHSILGIVLTAGVLYAVTKLYRFDVDRGFIDPQYLWAIIAAVIAYVIGRSRRLAYLIATLGILFMDIVHAVESGVRNLNAPTMIGGAGAFDTIVIAGVLAALIAEVLGESLEALQGGPSEKGKSKELVNALDHPEGTEDRKEK